MHALGDPTEAELELEPVEAFSTGSNSNWNPRLECIKSVVETELDLQLADMGHLYVGYRIIFDIKMDTVDLKCVASQVRLLSVDWAPRRPLPYAARDAKNVVVHTLSEAA
ncbi:hypothetical protein MRX96_037512 [Rhipicephalus microplus]